MKRLVASLIFFIGISLPTNAQLADGTTAPDFILSDLDGSTHHLYQYLAEGKTVFIKFFACHCPSCWGYYNTGKLESLYNLYGPLGTDQVRVLMIEHDEYNSDAFYGLGGYTQGDWVTGNPVPIIDAEWPNRGIFDDYNMTYYPMIYKICPDKKTELMSTAMSVADLYQKADDCPGTLSISEALENKVIRVDFENQQLLLNDFDNVSNVEIVNSLGQQMVAELNSQMNSVDVSSLTNGIYFVRIAYGEGIITKKVYLP